MPATERHIHHHQETTNPITSPVVSKSIEQIGLVPNVTDVVIPVRLIRRKSKVLKSNPIKIKPTFKAMTTHDHEENCGCSHDHEQPAKVEITKKEKRERVPVINNDQSELEHFHGSSCSHSLPNHPFENIKKKESDTTRPRRKLLTIASPKPTAHVHSPSCSHHTEEHAHDESVHFSAQNHQAHKGDKHSGHIHGPNCNHGDSNHDTNKHAAHAHGPNCNHGDTPTSTIDHHKTFKDLGKGSKELGKFPSTEIIPSNELGIWRQSLSTATDSALSLVLTSDQMDPATKKVLENTVAYRLGFSPDPRHLSPEEVILNRSCDGAIVDHLKNNSQLAKDANPGQIATGLLLMRSVRFEEKEMQDFNIVLNTVNPKIQLQNATIEEQRPMLNYIIKIGDNETNFSYSQILQVIALSLSIQVRKEGQQLDPQEQKIIDMSALFGQFGFTLSNFRSDTNPYIQDNPYFLGGGRKLQDLEKALAENNPTALKLFFGQDAHAREKDAMGLHGTIKLEDGKIVQDLCPDHTQKVTEQLQKVEQINKVQTTKFLEAKQMKISQPFSYSPRYDRWLPGGGGRSYEEDRRKADALKAAELARRQVSVPTIKYQASFSDISIPRSDSRIRPSSTARRKNNDPVDVKKHKTGFAEERITKPLEVKRKLLLPEVISGGKSPLVPESIATTKRPEDASGRVFITRDGDPRPQPSLTLVREIPSGGIERVSLGSVSTTKLPEQTKRTTYINRADSVPLTLIKNTPSGGVDRSALHSTPTTNRPAEAVQVAYISNDSESAPLTFVKTVRSGGKPKEVIASIKKTSNSSKAGRTEYVNDGIARTFVKNVSSGGSNSSVNNGPTTNNPSEAASVSYVNSGADRPTVSSPITSEPRPITSARSYRPDVGSAVSSRQPTYIDRQLSSIDSNSTVEPRIPRFTTSSIDTGPRNPSPTKPNPNRSLNNGENVGKTVTKPVDVPSITIGTNLSKAFEKVQEKAKEETTVSTQAAQNQQQEQVATALGETQHEKIQKKVSKKIEAGESFGTNATNEAVEQSAGTSTSASSQGVQDKSESTPANAAPLATQTRQTRGSLSNATEAARITELETPKGKVKIIEGGKTANVSANVPQRAQTARVSSDDPADVVAKGTDEDHEEAQSTQAQVAIQSKQFQPASVVQRDIVSVKQATRRNAASFALSVNNDYLDFTNPHSIQHAFLSSIKFQAFAIAA